MTVVVALLAFVAGIAVGIAFSRWRQGSRPVSPADLAPVPAPAPAPAPAAPAPVPESGPGRPSPEASAVESSPPEPAGTETDPDLKPVLDATRGVVSALEQRYQGARAAGDDEPAKPARRPRQARRRDPRS